MAATTCSGLSRHLRLPLATSLFLFFFSINTTHAASATPSKLFSLFQGIDVSSQCFDVIPDVISVTNCVSLCQENAPRCQSGSYHVTRRTCCLCDVSAFYDNLSFHDDPDGVFFQDANLSMDIVHNGWTMVFRATAGSGTNYMSVWNDTSGRHDDGPLGNSDLELGCMTLNGSFPCKSHFRSQYLSLWDTLNVQQVSLRLYVKGSEKVNLVFNGTGSDVNSWMTPARVLSTPWSDAKQNSSSYNVIGVLGVPDRSFYMNQKYNSCNGDKGWIAASDSAGYYGCPWDNITGSQPQFLYSARTTSVFFSLYPNGGVGAADVLAVFIKY